MVRLLMIGDVVGRHGRNTVSAVLPSLKGELAIDYVTANGENAAGGFGITKDTAKELIAAGVDGFTSGNHIWDKTDIVPYLQENSLPIARPLNYPSMSPGLGYIVLGNLLIVSLLGRTFMPPIDCPFEAMDELLSGDIAKGKIVVVDFHAEATSEKGALGWHLDGRVAAVVGTHTHVGTVDTQILPKGTAFVTDLGMTGPTHSIIGSSPDDVLYRFLTLRPRRLNVVTTGPARFNSVLIEINESSGFARSITRIDKELTI